MQEGYEVCHGGKCITVFSAPNYCDRVGNKGAFIQLSHANDLKPKFIQFQAVSHPIVSSKLYANAMSKFGF